MALLLDCIIFFFLRYYLKWHRICILFLPWCQHLQGVIIFNLPIGLSHLEAAGLVVLDTFRHVPGFGSRVLCRVTHDVTRFRVRLSELVVWTKHGAVWELGAHILLPMCLPISCLKCPISLNMVLLLWRRLLLLRLLIVFLRDSRDHRQVIFLRLCCLPFEVFEEGGHIDF